MDKMARCTKTDEAHCIKQTNTDKVKKFQKGVDKRRGEWYNIKAARGEGRKFRATSKLTKKFLKKV